MLKLMKAGTAIATKAMKNVVDQKNSSANFICNDSRSSGVGRSSRWELGYNRETSTLQNVVKILIVLININNINIIINVDFKARGALRNDQRFQDGETARLSR